MRCNKCKQPISKVEFNKAKIKKDEQGRLVSVLHNKCWLAISKPRHSDETPSAYEAAARRRTADDITVEAEAQRTETDRRYREMQMLAVRQAEIAAQREMDDDPRGWADHRDPAELEI